MLLKTLLALLASTTALAVPTVVTGTKPAAAGVQKDTATPGADLTTRLLLANTAANRESIIAEGGNASFVFNYNSPPANATTASPAGSLVIANAGTFPPLIGFKSALAVINLSPCAMVAPHLHPRADEFIIVTNGSLFTQFITENGAVLISNNLTAYEATMFAKGSIHLEFNPGCEAATFVAAFNDNDPGVSLIAPNFFELEEQLVIATLGGDMVFSGADLASVEHGIPASAIYLVQECVQRCGIKPNAKRSIAEVVGRKV
jgi:hypothetical protein